DGVALVLPAYRLLRGDLRDRRGRLRDPAEIFIDPRVELLRVEVAGDNQGGVVGAVEGVVERDHVLQRRGFQIGDTADGRALLRMHRVGIRVDPVEQLAVGIGQYSLEVYLLHH